jgi:hypothetical protein
VAKAIAAMLKTERLGFLQTLRHAILTSMTTVFTSSDS